MDNELSYADITRVVLIGTTECPKDPKHLPRLPQVAANIDELARLFRDPAVIGLNDAADLVRLEDIGEASAVLDRVASEAKQATDTFVVYYAGHGLYGDARQSLYLAAHNSTSEGRKFNAIPVDALREAIATSSARKRILILDCCFSGSGIGLMSNDDTVESVKRSIDIEGTYAIAAVPANMKALAPPGSRLTVFTEALVSVLEKGVEGKPHVLTLGDIFEEVHSRLKRRADVPLPEGLAWKEGREFRFARNRFVRHENLEVLANSVEGLRLTVAQYGAQIERLESAVRGREQIESVDALSHTSSWTLTLWINILTYASVLVLLIALERSSYSMQDTLSATYGFVLFFLLIFNIGVFGLSVDSNPDFARAKDVLGVAGNRGTRQVVLLLVVGIIAMVTLFTAREQVTAIVGQAIEAFLSLWKPSSL